MRLHLVSLALAVLGLALAATGSINIWVAPVLYAVPMQLLAYHVAAGHNQYAPMIGVPELREQISLKLGASYGRLPDVENEITVTLGATEAIFSAVVALVHPGEEAILFDPSYDSYAPAVIAAGGRPILVVLSLRRALPGSWIYIISHPHPPGTSFAPGSAFVQRSRLDRSLPAHLDGRLGAQSADLDHDGAVGRRVFDHELGPQRVAILEVGRGVRRPQRLEAVELRTSGGNGKPGKFEDHPGTPVHFPQVQREVLPRRRYPDLGSAGEGGFAVVFEALPVALENDGIGGGARSELGELARVADAQPAHVGIAGFGGAFLAMVGLKFFFDADKEVHWIGVVERQLAAVGEARHPARGAEVAS